MVLNTDAGQKAMCPGCQNVIKHREPSRVVDDGKDIWHADCFKMKHGELSAMDEREARDRRVQNWAHFNMLPTNPYGARRVA